MTPKPTPPDVVAAFQRGGVVEVLKVLLEVKGVSSQAKDHHLGNHFGSGAKPANVGTSATDSPRKVDELSPGEVPRGSKDVWLLLVAAVYVAHYFFGR